MPNQGMMLSREIVEAMSPSMQRSYGALLLEDRLAKVTSGSWEAHGDPSRDIRFVQTIRGGDMEIARVASLSGSREDEALANTKLIAAAPKLARAAFLALALICDRFPHEHGSADVGLAWEALDNALRHAFE